GERLPDALEAVRVGKERSVAGRPPAVVAVGPEAKLLPASVDDGLLPCAEEHGIHRRVRLEPARDGLRAGAGAGEPVDLGEAVGGGNEELRVGGRAARREQGYVGERPLELHALAHGGLAMVRAQDDLVALEEGVAAAGGLEQRTDGGVAARERL